MLEKIEYIARKAGEIIREGFNNSILVEYKTNSSNLVTNIDKSSEKTIIDYVNKEFPGHSIIAEESGSAISGSDFTWVIDPLDGTTNFAHRLPIFSVSIGLLKGKETIYGLVYDVMRDTVYKAEKGSGSFENDKKISVSENEDLKKGVLVTGFPYDIHNNPDNAIEKFNSFLLNSRAVRRLGSAALDFCYVASGVFDGFWEVNLSPWDIAGGKLIVEEAGGIVTNFAGHNIDAFSKQILASNRKVHQRMMEILSKN